MRQAVIVNFNTPELCEAAILSLWKHGCQDVHVTIFDNSDTRPFIKKMENVSVIDNTKGQVIDFDKELEKYPDRDASQGCAAGCEFGSAKHMITVQKLWDIIGEGFLLMDSDVLIKADINHMFNYEECTVGHIQTWDLANNPKQIDRLIPILLWINVPMCKKGGARFFDPERSFALMPGGQQNRANWYDTGASFLEDIRTLKPQCHGLSIDIRPLMIHYGSGSWRNNDLKVQLEWCELHRDLWAPDDEYQLGCAEVEAKPFNENARIYVLGHHSFKCAVNNPVFQPIDMSQDGDTLNGMRGGFYSELMGMKMVNDEKKLPSIVGFCGYRKYFEWMSVVPDLERMLRARGAVVSWPINLHMPMRKHYATVANVEDLDIVTAIIDKHHKAFGEAWHKALESNQLHPFSMFVMKSKDFRRLFKLIWSVVEKYRKQVGNIDERIANNKKAYHIPPSSATYQYRIGGQICERIVSAWIDWQFPQAEGVAVNITDQPR